ncbi:DNA/RNA helicase [Paenibacillus sp.]|uniref:DNA/RNA helicase n=1 Tax=Paenibacillus sp. TaxID=58172 RepID=UPI002D3A919F|nr:DNA/RNA helicase [Paenibacillus sp.]HZG85025.1 DNA/RNA helicase [Paenibacillus sp.]
MSHDAIRLQFPDMRAASEAFELLQELDYRPEIVCEGERPELDVHIVRSDVQSALEIAHAYGGHLLEAGASHPAPFRLDLGELDIPAHTVTEDFSEDYAEGMTNAYLGDDFDAANGGYDSGLR